ncbi:MAG: prolipoprotein diacylglyceryl transferase family protein, partial [Polyangiaceae bacterium]
GSLGDILSMRSGGLVAYGGFLGGFLGSWSYLRLKRIRLLPWADVAVPSLAAGLMITRIGCYLFGCDYGGTLTAEAPAWLKSLGTFPRWDAATLPGSSGSPAWVRHQELGLIDASTTSSLPVHPTQIYESLLGLSLLVLLLWARRRQSFRGQIFLLFTFAYGVGRFLLEMVRDDPERGTVPPSLPEHILLPLCLALFAGGYAVSVSRLIDSERARRISQALAFLPALALVITLRPENFAGSELMALSTSQFIGLASGVAACGAYFVFDRAALAHPETAMSLDLPSDLVEESRESEATPKSDPETDAGSDPPRAEPEEDAVGRAEAGDGEAASSDDDEAASSDS